MTFSGNTAPSKDLTRATEGEIELADYPSLKFSKMEIDDETLTVGDEVFNPSTGSKERLPGEPTFGTMRLMTPESPFMRSALEKLVRDCKANPRKLLTIAHRKAGQVRLYQGRLGSNRVDTGYDKDANQTTSSQLMIQIELTKREPLS